MNFTPEQQDAITNTAARLCVDAGAGSGKTRVLVERIVHLVDQRGVPLEQIAAITFTEKAAAEMKARLRKTFRERAQAAEDDPVAMSRWRDLEHRVDTARISTIHAFCAGFLREYALHIGLDPDFSVLADAETALLLSDTVRGAVVGLLEAQDAAALELTAEYGPAALRDTLETMIRQAPAVRQAAAQYPFDDPEALYAAWQERIETERRAALEQAARGASVSRFIARLQRFDGLCAVESDAREVLRQLMLTHLRALKTARGSVIEEHLQALTTKVGRAQKKNWESESVYDALKGTQEAVRDFANKLLEWPELSEEIDLAAARRSCALFAVFEHAAAAWEDAKRAANGMDFDGLIFETLRVLRENADVRARAARGLRHLLMDEFQDTDRSQLEIAALICGVEDGPSFFFVGDPKQSIYNFRGAEVELFSEERGKTTAPIPLLANFRTLPPLIRFINSFFQSTDLLNAVGDYVGMDAGRAPEVDPHEAPRVEMIVVPERDDAGEKRNAEDTRWEEARLIAARIQALCDPNGPPVVHDENGTWRPAQPKDIALLFRGTTSFYIYEEALRAAGIDFIATAGSGFHRRQEVLDVVNLLRVVVGPRDGAALAAFLRSPIGRMSDDGLLLLAADRGLVAGFAREDAPTPLSIDDAHALAQARALVADLRAKRHWPVFDLLQDIYARTGIEAIALDHHYGLQKASNLRKLLALAIEFSTHQRAPLDRFVRYLAEVAEHEALREGDALMQPLGGGAVTLMSVHKSKGLEFPVVFVCDMGQGQQDSREHTLFLHRDLGWVLTGANARGETVKPALARVISLRAAAKNEAESARLLYVAMTRARDFLVLCGKENPGKGSWFEVLNEVHEVTALGQGALRREPGWSLRVVRAAAALPRAARDAASISVGAVTAAIRRVATPLEAAKAPVSLSVSALLDLMSEARDEVEAEVEAREPGTPSGGAWAMRRGTVVHRLFELWDFVGAPPIEAALEDAPLAPSERATMRNDLAAIAERTRGLPVFAALSATQELRRELPFSLAIGDAIVRGTIDALAEGRLVVDYKTGRRRPEKQTRYAMQLQLYAAALRAIRGNAPAEAVVIYVDEACEERVDLSTAHLDDVLKRAECALLETFGRPE